MPSTSAKLGLYIFSGSDQYNIAEFDDNFSILEASASVLLCTSTSRPTWGAAQDGMLISESDTGLVWRWNGSAFVRLCGSGELGYANITTSVSTGNTWSPTASGVYLSAVTQSVTVPAGGRRLRITAEVPEVQNSSGLTYLLLLRNQSSSTYILNSYPVWSQQMVGTGNTNNAGTSGSFTTFDIPAAGAAQYELAFAASPTLGGESVLVAAANRPVSLSVFEE